MPDPDAAVASLRSMIVASRKMAFLPGVGIIHPRVLRTFREAP